jgi:hypothetical protein
VTVLEDGSGDHLHLIPATAAEPARPPDRPGVGPGTSRTGPAGPPTESRKIINAGFFTAEAPLHFE